jgi:hypothetical protein
VAWSLSALADLTEILARLYSTEREARRVVDYAGLDSTRIEFESAAINNWFSILQEASKHESKIDAIIRVALDEHPRNEALRRVAQAPPMR